MFLFYSSFPIWGHRTVSQLTGTVACATPVCPLTIPLFRSSPCYTRSHHKLTIIIAIVTDTLTFALTTIIVYFCLLRL